MAGPESEDRKIRRLLVATTAVLAIDLLGVALIITVMISANFNPLRWLE